jgi:hypothetical protein
VETGLSPLLRLYGNGCNASYPLPEMEKIGRSIVARQDFSEQVLEMLEN